jgi:hypothetical protein
MSTLEVNTINPQSGNDVTIGGSSKNVKFASGTTVDFSTNTPTLTLGTAMKNTPAFSAYAGSDQNGNADDTYTKLAMNTEFYDTDNKYDTSTYRFTPGVAGKYNFGACVHIDASANHISVNLALYKNGSQLFYTSEDVDATKATTINATIELDSDDYVELYAKADVESSGTWNMNQDGTTANNRAFWFGYKLIGA